MRLAIASAVALGSLLATLHGQMPSPATQSASKTGTGLLLGRVVDAATNRPLADALVTLWAPAGDRRKVIVDPEGRFVFTNLPEGEFTLTASKAGYLDGKTGQLVPTGPSRPIVLQAGERVGDVVLRLWGLSAIGGVALDDTGEPAVGVEVRLLQRTVLAGQRVLAPEPSHVTITDDRGAYRLAGVTPGEYLMYARSPADVGQRALMTLAMGDQSAMASVAARAAAGGHIEDIVDLDASLRVYPPVFYPNAATPADAQPIRVGAGEERSGVDLRLRAVPIARVAGTLLHDGKPAPQTIVTLRLTDPATGAGVEVASGASGEDGRFAIAGVPRGAYTLRALHAGTGHRPGRRGRGQPAPQEAPPAAEPVLWATRPVVAGAPESASLSIVLQPGPRMRGRVQFDAVGPSPRPEEITALAIAPIAANAPGIVMGAVVSRGAIQADGTFDSGQLPPGRYRLNILERGAAPNAAAVRRWRIASAVSGGIDLVDTTVDLTTDLDVVVTVTDRPTAGIGGRVTTVRGTPDREAIVVVLPDDPRLIASQRVRVLYSTSTGAYSAADLVAGDYVVALTSDEVVVAGLDREALTRLMTSGTRVTLAEGERRTLDLRSERRP